jgi:hypothetical protein
MATTTQPTRNLFVDGRWQPASSGETYVKYNPKRPSPRQPTLKPPGHTSRSRAAPAT